MNFKAQDLFDESDFMVNGFNPFEDETVFPESPEFFGSDTPATVAKKLTAQHTNKKLEPNFTKNLEEILKKSWPEKDYNPVGLKTWLFGGDYHFQGDPYNSQVMDGWNTFWYWDNPETYDSFKTFKDSIELCVDQFGYNDDTGMCDDLSSMDIDSNPKHHKFEMPNDSVIKSWYKEMLNNNAEDLKPKHLKILTKELTAKTEINLADIKKEAYELKKSENIPQHNANETVAKKHGFQNYHEAQKVLAKVVTRKMDVNKIVEAFKPLGELRKLKDDEGDEVETNDIFEDYKPHTLKAITEIVKEDVSGYGDDKSEIKKWLNDLTTNGCQSGMVPGLIYYNDTCAFFEKHKKEINSWLSETLSDMGCSVDEMFGKKWDKEDPMCLDTNNQNLLAWAAYEEAGRGLLDYLES